MTRDEFIKHCNDFNKVLLEATEEGLLDDLQDDIEQGTINSVCDGVEELSLMEYSYNIEKPLVLNHLGSNQIPAAIEGGVDDLDR